ncbi:MAG TPA: flagellar hook capping FlgD N-terminal domain-containing protein [Mycobacterium sp.]|nr:flagellar hook capping FlgD N-terminal domain-containing protein [Mycobacterium sp.]
MTTPVSSVAAAAASSSTTSTTQVDRSQLSSQAFLQLLIAQLQFQDPTKPVDTSALMSQTATLNQIQTMQQLSAASTAQTATNMVGHNVTYTNGDGVTATGFVSGASLSGSTPTLTIGGETVALAHVQQVLATTTPATP